MRSGIAALLISIVPPLAAASVAAAQQPLARTESGHLPPVPQGGYELPLAPPLTHFQLLPRMIILNTKLDWRKTGRIDKDLSLACAARAFRERNAMQYRAIFSKTEVLGVAFGNGTNLVDEKRKAERDKIYLFRHGDSTACVVVVMTRDEWLAANDRSGATPAAGQQASPPKIRPYKGSGASTAKP